MKIKKLILPIIIAVVSLVVIFGIVKALNNNTLKDSPDSNESVKTEDTLESKKMPKKKVKLRKNKRGIL